MSKPLWYMFGGTILAGLIFAIYILSGINIDPNDLAIDITGKAIQSVNNAQAVSFWNTFTGLYAIIGIIEIIKDILSYFAFGWPGVIVASTGFLGILLIILGNGGIGTSFGIFFLLFGAIICFICEGEAPEDFISRHIQ